MSTSTSLSSNSDSDQDGNDDISTSISNIDVNVKRYEGLSVSPEFTNQINHEQYARVLNKYLGMYDQNKNIFGTGISDLNNLVGEFLKYLSSKAVLKIWKYLIDLPSNPFTEITYSVAEYNTNLRVLRSYYNDEWGGIRILSQFLNDNYEECYSLEYSECKRTIDTAFGTVISNMILGHRWNRINSDVDDRYLTPNDCIIKRSDDPIYHKIWPCLGYFFELTLSLERNCYENPNTPSFKFCNTSNPVPTDYILGIGSVLRNGKDALLKAAAGHWKQVDISYIGEVQEIIMNDVYTCMYQLLYGGSCKNWIVKGKIPIIIGGGNVACEPHKDYVGFGAAVYQKRIYLCPDVVELIRLPDRNNRNICIEKVDWLRVIMHELSHYAVNANDFNAEGAEVYGSQDCTKWAESHGPIEDSTELIADCVALQYKVVYCTDTDVKSYVQQDIFDEVDMKIDGIYFNTSVTVNNLREVFLTISVSNGSGNDYAISSRVLHRDGCGTHGYRIDGPMHIHCLSQRLTPALSGTNTFELLENGISKSVELKLSEVCDFSSAVPGTYFVKHNSYFNLYKPSTFEEIGYTPAVATSSFQLLGKNQDEIMETTL